MESRKEKAINCFKNGNYKTGFGLIKQFKYDFNDNEIRLIQIAQETMDDERHKKFYMQLDIDVDNVIEEAKEIVNKKYKI